MNYTKKKDEQKIKEQKNKRFLKDLIKSKEQDDAKKEIKRILKEVNKGNYKATIRKGKTLKEEYFNKLKEAGQKAKGLKIKEVSEEEFYLIKK